MHFTNYQRDKNVYSNFCLRNNFWINVLAQWILYKLQKNHSIRQVSGLFHCKKDTPMASASYKENPQVDSISLAKVQTLGRAIHGPTPVYGGTLEDILGPLVHTNFARKRYGPMALKVLWKFQSWPVLVHRLLFPETYYKENVPENYFLNISARMYHSTGKHYLPDPYCFVIISSKAQWAGGQTLGADFWEGNATKHVSVKERCF